MVSGPDHRAAKVLLFTFCEYGQANVNLALAYELALNDAEVHIASFAPLEKRVERLQDAVKKKRAELGKTSTKVGLIDFHLCKGPTHFEALEEVGMNEYDLPHGPGVKGALRSYSFLDVVVAPMPGKRYTECIESCQEIVKTVRPDVAVSDSMFRAAVDACLLLKQKYFIMSPNSYKELVLDAQPAMGMLWKYPALSSGFAFPVPWSNIPANIYLHIRMILTLVRSPRVQQLQACRKEAGLVNHFFESRAPGVQCLCPSLPEIDFPFAVIPDDIVSCGPIVYPGDSVEESDPELVKWLEKGPTVLINLGSHAMADENLSREFAGGLRTLLDCDDTGKIQILWKVKAYGNIGDVLDTILGLDIKEGRVRIVDWLQADPVAILQHPNVKCTVHHGGANSFYEGVWAGVPHVVLPLWYDTYDFARRAEFLKIGLFGSVSSAPRVIAAEFGDALVKVMTDTKEAAMFRENAERLKIRCQNRGNGREVACQAVLSAIGPIAGKVY